MIYLYFLYNFIIFLTNIKYLFQEQLFKIFTLKIITTPLFFKLYYLFLLIYILIMNLK